MQVADYELDGREGRAQFVRRRRREPIELGQMLLAGQDQLRRCQSVVEATRLLRNPPGIGRSETRAEDDSPPDPGSIEKRQLETSGPETHGSGR